MTPAAAFDTSALSVLQSMHLFMCVKSSRRSHLLEFCLIAPSGVDEYLLKSKLRKKSIHLTITILFKTI